MSASASASIVCPQLGATEFRMIIILGYPLLDVHRIKNPLSQYASRVVLDLIFPKKRYRLFRFLMKDPQNTHPLG